MVKPQEEEELTSKGKNRKIREKESKKIIAELQHEFHQAGSNGIARLSPSTREEGGQDLGDVEHT